jgi:hypothetical protein
MKALLILAVGLVSGVASAAKNPFPVLASCNLILYDVPGGATVASDSKEVVLPAFHLSPSADLMLSGTRNGKTYNFSGHAVRDDGTDYMSITLSKFVGDLKVELVDSRTSTDTRFEPYDTLNGVYHVLEANKRIGYFACGMYVRAAE